MPIGRSRAPERGRLTYGVKRAARRPGLAADARWLSRDAGPLGWLAIRRLLVEPLEQSPGSAKRGKVALALE